MIKEIREKYSHVFKQFYSIIKPISYENLVKNKYYPAMTSEELLDWRSRSVNDYNEKLYNVYKTITEEFKNHIITLTNNKKKYWGDGYTFETYTEKYGIRSAEHNDVYLNVKYHKSILNYIMIINECNEIYLELRENDNVKRN